MGKLRDSDRRLGSGAEACTASATHYDDGRYDDGHHGHYNDYYRHDHDHGDNDYDPSASAAAPSYACSNGIDDDGDGKIDYPADPGCTSSSDTNETDAPPQSNCHASYPDFCIPPPPPDKDCGDFSQKNFTVRHDVVNPDPHRLDGDKDGRACES